MSNLVERSEFKHSIPGILGVMLQKLPQHQPELGMIGQIVFVFYMLLIVAFIVGSEKGSRTREFLEITLVGYVSLVMVYLVSLLIEHIPFSPILGIPNQLVFMGIVGVFLAFLLRYWQIHTDHKSVKKDAIQRLNQGGYGPKTEAFLRLVVTIDPNHQGYDEFSGNFIKMAENHYRKAGTVPPRLQKRVEKQTETFHHLLVLSLNFFVFILFVVLVSAIVGTSVFQYDWRLSTIMSVIFGLEIASLLVISILVVNLADWDIGFDNIYTQFTWVVILAHIIVATPDSSVSIALMGIFATVLGMFAVRWGTQKIVSLVRIMAHIRVKSDPGFYEALFGFDALEVNEEAYTYRFFEWIHHR